MSHVSQLKKHVGEAMTSSFIHVDDTIVIIGKKPKVILDHMTK